MTRLLTVKARVAPLKTVPPSRLELCETLLLSEMISGPIPPSSSHGRRCGSWFIANSGGKDGIGYNSEKTSVQHWGLHLQSQT